MSTKPQMEFVRSRLATLLTMPIENRITVVTETDSETITSLFQR